MCKPCVGAKVVLCFQAQLMYFSIDQYHFCTIYRMYIRINMSKTDLIYLKSWCDSVRFCQRGHFFDSPCRNINCHFPPISHRFIIIFLMQIKIHVQKSAGRAGQQIHQSWLSFPHLANVWLFLDHILWTLKIGLQMVEQFIVNLKHRSSNEMVKCLHPNHIYYCHFSSKHNNFTCNLLALLTW